jgi:hypothetical protein
MKTLKRIIVVLVCVLIALCAYIHFTDKPAHFCRFEECYIEHTRSVKHENGTILCLCEEHYWAIKKARFPLLNWDEKAK